MCLACACTACDLGCWLCVFQGKFQQVITMAEKNDVLDILSDSRVFLGRSKASYLQAYNSDACSPSKASQLIKKCERTTFSSLNEAFFKVKRKEMLHCLWCVSGCSTGSSSST